MNTKDLAAMQLDLVRLTEGLVVRAGESGYDETLTIDNGRIVHKPYLTAIPFSTNDVQATVRYCSKEGLRLTTKSGGHSAAGYCLNSDGIVLDLRHLNSIGTTSSASQLTVGAGARWIQVYDYLEQQHSNLTAIGGGCGTVGLGGYLLGGGFSFVSRSYGLACDNVRAIEFVAADGCRYSLDDNLTDPNTSELYWALRGSGGGNFGIATSVTLQLHETAASRLLMGQISFPFERLAEVLAFYNSWAPTLPAELAVYGMLRASPDPRQHGRPILQVRLNPVYNGDFSTGIGLLEPLLKMRPEMAELYAMTIPEWEDYIGNGTSLNGRCAYIRSAVMNPCSLTEEVATICFDNMAAAPSQDSFVVWTHTGGRIRDLDESESSFPHRKAEFVFELKSIWEPSAPETARRNIEWAVDFFDALGRYSDGAYVNYIDPLLENWTAQYYGQSYGRLLEVQAYWDPARQFLFQQGIGSDYVPRRSRPLDLSPLLRT